MTDKHSEEGIDTLIGGEELRDPTVAISTDLTDEQKEAIKLYYEINYRNFDKKNSKLVTRNEDVALNTSLKDIPDPLLMVGGTGWTAWSKFPYIIAATPGFNVPVSWNTQSKPIACYLKLIESKSVINEATYDLIKMKGTSSTKTVYRETTVSITAVIKNLTASASVTTGYSYSDTISEEVITGWSEHLKKGKYNIYQNVVLYAFSIRITPDEDINLIKRWMDNAGDKNPRTYIKNNKLYYFVEMHRNDPFIVPFSDNLYYSFTKDEVVSYCVGDGYGRW